MVSLVSGGSACFFGYAAARGTRASRVPAGTCRNEARHALSGELSARSGISLTGGADAAGASRHQECPVIVDMRFHIISSGEFGYSGAFAAGNPFSRRCAAGRRAFAVLLTIRIPFDSFAP
jgi:hypothetical protein